MPSTLFPELIESEVSPSAPTRVAPTTSEAGAAELPLPDGRRLDLAGVPARTALVRQQPSRGGRWCDWSADPYRGCELGFGSWDARDSHDYLGHGEPRHDHARHDILGDSESRGSVKDGFVDALLRDVAKRVKPGDHIAFGTATDPYQPLERRERVMNRALRALLHAGGLLRSDGLGAEGLKISITTKSALIARDAKLLARLAERHAVHVNFSISTIDARLARFLEPGAPTPEKLLEALRTLRRHGVEAGVFMMPLLPGVTDLDVDIDRLLGAAADAGARWLGSQVVFLREPSRSHFLHKLKLSYPRVAARYAWWTKTDTRLPEQIRGEALGRVRRLALQHELPSQPNLQCPTPRRRLQSTFAFGGEV